MCSAGRDLFTFNNRPLAMAEIWGRWDAETGISA